MPRKNRRRNQVPEDSIQQTCLLCNLPDDSEMVCCDKCKQWFHFNCVGVNEDVANRSWSCPDCAEARDPALQLPLSSTPPAVVTGELQSFRPPQSPFASPRVPIAPPTRVSPVPSPRTPTPRPRVSGVQMNPPPTPLPRTPRPQNQLPPVAEIPEVQIVDPEVADEVHLVNRLPVDLRIQFLEQQEAIEQRYLRRRFQLLLETPVNVNAPSGHEENVPVDRNIGFPPVFHSSPVCHNQLPPRPTSQNRIVSPFVPILQPQRPNHDQPSVSGVPISRIDRQVNFSAFRSHPTDPTIHRPIASTLIPPQTDNHPTVPAFSHPGDNHRPRNSAFAPLMGSLRPPAQELFPSAFHDDPTVVGGTALLNKSQIAARHAVPKELPIFTGEPEEWPLFFASFENTTHLCGFTAEENMVRLQKCLKGKALEAVKCQLLHPSNLDQVIATLKMLFGRPEIIVHSLLQKINSLPAPKADRLGTLVDFALAVRNMVATVKACELEEHLCNLTLLHSLTERLPPMIRLNWATHRQSLQSVTLAEFSDWLYKLAEAASTVTMPQFAGAIDNKSRRGRKDDGFLNAHAEATPKVKQLDTNRACLICQGSCAAVEKCGRFLSFGLSARWDELREHKLCRSCLGNHRGPCKSAKPCGKSGCQYKHHRLLHNDAKDKPETSSSGSRGQAKGLQQAVAPVSRDVESCNTHRGGSKSALFQYIPIVLYNNGIELRTHAFLDSGSSLTLMEESLAKQLDLNGEKSPLCLRWTADTCRYEKDATIVSLNISGTYDGSSLHTLREVYTVKDLKLPTQSLPTEELADKYSHLKGLPIEPYSNVQPKLLIGVSNARVMHILDDREGKLDEPVAVKTRLGWTVYGTYASVKDSIPRLPHSFHICSHFHGTDDSLHEAVKNYFALDSLGISAPQNQLLSKEDERALAMLREVTTFQDGRYQAGLLWKYDDVRLPNNRSMALRRHRCLTKRMEREPQLARTLRAKMQDYEQKGYIRKLTPEESRATGDRTWYLPIFPVFNPNKPGKIRIVFDAAASLGDVSLNSVLMKGPDQLNALPPVLYKFRERLIGLGGDVAEMFHQIRMRPSDEHSQRILWCDSEDPTEPCDYVMQVVTFGATCSPSTALYVLNENASRFEEKYPVAVDAICRRHYVDDMLTSVDTEEEAIQLAKEVRYIHHEGGFHMRNWVSNSSAVLEALGENPKSEKSMEMNTELAMEKVLGMWWNTTSDVFSYKLCTDRNRELLSGAKHPTKRDVLRTLMAIYDPLGLIAHYLMYLKVLLQEIWRAKTGWDDPIEEKHLEKWLTWLRILPELESVKIPRCYFRHVAGIDNATVELHTFVDASESGFAAVSYFRFEVDGYVECALIGSKTRVAPLKFVSIPRLELQAAVIGTRLAQSVAEGHSIKIDRRYFWTDARDVMCWLQSDHRRYSQFVAFRVGEILEATDITEWRWLGTKHNVADDGTKWKCRPDLKPTSRWFTGPSFLWNPKSEWPSSTLNSDETTNELRASFLYHMEGTVRTILQAENYSSWQRLLRVTAFVHRFIGNIKRKQKKESMILGPLTQDELSAAESFQFRQAQADVYGEQLAAISSKKTTEEDR
ncbi:uncharacterized protein LOC134286379 [Aedes albopictus]|uniref:PHD-type domain-containing protein n=1 Tax=Aedes albopictus TaxID=7160 RepID=A0ABM1Z3Z9_AEDAL